MPRPNTEFVYLQGKLAWVRCIMPEKYGEETFWSATIYPNAESLEKVREMNAEGVKNVIKKDEEGWFVRYKRPAEKKTKDGRRFSLIAPEIVDKDGNPWDGRPIGNGSDGTLKLEVYKHKTPSGGDAKAARLLGVKIDNLIPFVKENYNEDQQRSVAGLEKQPEQKVGW